MAAPAVPGMNIIECAGLGKRYRQTWALRDRTLGIPAGHVVALVGPNGAGETFLGAPVMAREFETGTFRFAWMKALLKALGG
jgi:ABC-type branched-subunit amino acid transport system ATPase component